MEDFMKRYLYKISLSIMTLGLLTFSALTVLAIERPFHLVEHGKVTVTSRDETGNILDLVADGIGTATHLGLFTLHREAVLTSMTGGPVFDARGEATLI